MALFRRDSEATATEPSRSAAATEGVRPVTRIAPGTRFEGKVAGGTDLVVEGEVHGEVVVDAAVTIAPSGRVEGRVEARTVQVAGTVNGDVVGRDRVELAPSARLTGDVSSAKVVIAEGAFLKGAVEMRGGSEGPEGAGRR